MKAGRAPRYADTLSQTEGGGAPPEMRPPEAHRMARFGRLALV